MFGELFHARNDGLVYLGRTIYRMDFVIIVLVLHFFCRLRYVFDFDDPKYEQFPFRMWALTRFATFVTVGSHELARWAQRYNAHVAILPTSVPLSIYGPRPEKITLPVTIGWIGIGPNHRDNLALLRPILARLGKRFQFRLELLGTCSDPVIENLFRDLPGVEVATEAHLPWQDVSAVAEAIRRFDIGVMPLTDTPYNRAKCAFKAIECMASAVPVVASAVGESVYLIQHGANGFLAQTEDDWVEYLGRLLEDPSLRLRLGRKARQTIAAGYSIERTACTLLELVSKYSSGDGS
jgi:glycosyltransferase involved in cell wall biosynthesis